ncbi:MAG: glycoside hydrolase/phage tail family protein [Pannonibacter sp.]
MAALVLGAVGTAIGGAFGGTILGVSGAAIGGIVGSTIGSVADSWILSSLAPSQRIEGARLETLRITSATEGAVLPRLYGRMRIGGNIIWATDFREETRTATQGGGKGGGGKVRTTEYLYSASFAVALCEGPITGIGRIWADGKPMDLSGVTWRWYPGNEIQTADPFISAKMGTANTPAYRGTAYVVFEELPLAAYGNRLPQLSFEVFRPLADPDTAEGLMKAVTLIPASGEFTYAVRPVTKSDGTRTLAENLNALPQTTDILLALDRLQAMAPAVESISLVVAWIADDLRAGHCRIEPGIEVREKNTGTADWQVSGLTRADARLVSQDAQGRPVFGGTPADFAVIEAIREIKARGLRVTFYPFLLMDIPPGNALPDPYSDLAAKSGQPVFPWRGRITVSPAPGFSGSPDKTSAAATAVASFFGAASPSDYEISGDLVTWRGAPTDFGLRRMVLHYAHLCVAAGGVDAFTIGTEMQGLTPVRSGPANYSAVGAFRDLAAACRTILGPATKLGYAADWPEYAGHRPQDGSGDVFFHLDPLWADPNIDFIGIDNYMPLSDWRDGFEHADARAGWTAIHDRAYLQANIAGGEGLDWFYASATDRAAQIRTPITDGSAGKPWVFRIKDLRAWWSNLHFNRPGGVESATPTSWVPQSKPIWFTELGCPAIDRGTNQPNVFFDPKSSESFTPHFSRGWRDDAIQRAYIEATCLWWGDPANNPPSPLYGGRMVQLPECAAWTWDARPYPFFPELIGVWTDGPNWRLGHWLTGRLGAVSLAALVRHLCLRAGMREELIDVSGLWGAIEGYVIGALESPSASISALARHFGFDAVETGGQIRFVMRGRAPVATLAIDDLVAPRDGEPIELTRGQESELPQALKWQIARADEDYDAALVEARRITVDTTRIASESFPFATAPEEAERRCRRALMEAWIGRETATFTLPPSRLALDPADVIELCHDGRRLEVRLTSAADTQARRIEAVRQDRSVHDLPPGDTRPASLSRPVVFGPTTFAFLDLPQVREELHAHRPLIAAHANPWPGEIAVFRSPAMDGFEPIARVNRRARIGSLAADLHSGPTSRFDMGNVLILELPHGDLQSVSDLALFSGANVLAIESAPGQWEIVQAGSADLIAPRRYRLSRLLRGQRGTEHAMGTPTPAGARVVVLDDALVSLPVSEADLGRPWNWRIGPAARAVNDESYTGQSFTLAGRGLLPLAPVHVEQPWRTAQSPGDLTIRWTRRSRALVADSWEQVEVPLGEEVEGYDVQILDGATVKRTLTSSTTSVFYTAAQQTADWGAPLGPGQTLAIRIFQLSNRLGRGTPAIVTLQF